MPFSYIFRPVEDKDIWEIYEISNDPKVRRFSINTKPITEEEHKEWFNSVDKTLFFVAESEGKVVGQVRFKKAGGRTFEVSISVHPSWRGRGLGKFLLGRGLEELFKRFPGAIVIAKIKRENEISKRFFKNFGFELQNSKGEIETYIYKGSKKTSV